MSLRTFELLCNTLAMRELDPLEPAAELACPTFCTKRNESLVHTDHRVERGRYRERCGGSVSKS